MKRNPGISEETLLRRIRKFNVKNSFIMLFSVFFFLGILMALYYPDTEYLRLSITTFLFLSSIFMTTVSLQQTTFAGVFEPLKAMPVRGVEKHISVLFLIDSLAVLGIAVPPAILMASREFPSTVVYFLWLVFSVLFGHTLGMVFLAIFGFRVAQRSKAISKILFGVFVAVLILAMMPNLLVSGIFGEIAEFSRKYYFIYPFTVLSEIRMSFALLLIYCCILIPLNARISKVGVSKLLEPKFEMTSKATFRVFSGNKMAALILKDLKLIYRHPSGLVGVILPFIVIVPQIIVLGSLSGGNAVVIQAISTVALFSPIILGLITRGEGREIDFLKNLPISKEDFMLSKVLTSSFIVCSASLVLILIAFMFGATPLAFLIAVPLPMITCLFSALYLFDYPSREVGIPDMGIRRMAVLLFMCIILVALLLAPTLLFANFFGYTLTFFLSLIILAFMFRRLRNLERTIS